MFLQRYRPLINITRYVGETDPGLWLEDYSLTCRPDGVDGEYFIICNLPLFLADTARTWIKHLPPTSSKTGWTSRRCSWGTSRADTSILPTYGTSGAASISKVSLCVSTSLRLNARADELPTQITPTFSKRSLRVRVRTTRTPSSTPTMIYPSLGGSYRLDRSIGDQGRRSWKQPQGKPMRRKTTSPSQTDASECRRDGRTC